MASCPAEAILATNPCLLEVSSAALRTIIYGAAKNWAVATNPTLDVGLPGSMARAACLMEMSRAGLLTVIYSTLCNIAGGVTPTPPVTNDPDVQAFIDVVPITKQPDIDALNTLVRCLKLNSLWNSLDALYPMIGGTLNSCSYNLVNTAKYRITWHGGVTASVSGVTGNGTTGYGDTGFNASTAASPKYGLNTALMFISVNGAASYSGRTGAVIQPAKTWELSGFGTFLGQPAAISLNDGDSLSGITPDGQAVFSESIAYTSRTDANTCVFGWSNAGVFNSIVVGGGTFPANVVPAKNFLALVRNNNGTPDQFSSNTMSLFGFGSGWSEPNLVVGNPCIVNFQAALGRA